MLGNLSILHLLLPVLLFSWRELMLSFREDLRLCLLILLRCWERCFQQFIVEVHTDVSFAELAGVQRSNPVKVNIRKQRVALVLKIASYRIERKWECFQFLIVVMHEILLCQAGRSSAKSRVRIYQGLRSEYQLLISSQRNSLYCLLCHANDAQASLPIDDMIL